MDATLTNILFDLRERFLIGIASVCNEHLIRLVYVNLFYPQKRHIDV
jgi:hypothetical protein